MSIESRGRGYGPPVENITHTIGNTPLVRISEKLAPAGRTIYAKCEFFNPLSSVKDRLALAIIENAEKNGTLKPGQTVVEATSGNTGVAVAMVCAQRGYPCVITMAETFSIERRTIMRQLGAKVIITPKEGKGTGMVEKARELAEKHGWFLCHQFESDANWKFHYETTGPEILNDLEKIHQSPDYFVTGWGSGGTFTGAAKYLKENSPHTKIVLAEPETANLVRSGMKTVRHEDGTPMISHPAFRGHPIQGWAPDFIPLVLEKGLGMNLHDTLIDIPSGVAIKMSQALAKNEGIFTGVSGGASMWAAVQIARKAPEGSVIVTILPDTAERYLSTPLFSKINSDMSEDEYEIARSTPSWILDPPAPAVEQKSGLSMLCCGRK
mmetsp:Transcript_10410/g.22177  ORF Transcript_10410/g.22177 Transcript_10410/m.22177 type:complete len:381 (+) Transcript_10410:103-1245(+)